MTTTQNIQKKPKKIFKPKVKNGNPYGRKALETTQMSEERIKFIQEIVEIKRELRGEMRIKYV